MADFEVRGADNLVELRKRIAKHADKKAIQKELYSGLNRVTKKVRADMKEAILEPDALPTQNGLQALVHRRTSFSTRMRGGRDAGIRIVATNRQYDLAAMVRGNTRHPVFGRGKWVLQSTGIKPRFLDEPFEESAPDVRKEIERVMEAVKRKVEG